MSKTHANATSELLPWQASAWRTLALRAERGSLPHALLFSGEAGLGKRVVVESFVRARLCAHPRDGFACGGCRICALLNAGTHPDRILVTLEENPNTHKLRSEIVVEQIRDLSARLAMASQLGGWQIAVIDPADAMNPASANALLKTLEEPTASSMILLIADQPWRLPATIRSRCQRVDFAPPSRTDALAWLHARDVDGAENALNAAGGNPGRAFDFVRNGELERRDAVLHDLTALSAGRASAHALAKAWAADEPDARLEHAARVLLDSARRRGAGEHDALAWDVLALQARFEQANRLRELLRGPLRVEPALIEWFARMPHAP